MPPAEHDLAPVSDAKSRAIKADKKIADRVCKKGTPSESFLGRSQFLTQLIDGSADTSSKRRQRRATSKLDLILGAIAFALDKHSLSVMRDPVQQS